MSTEQSHFADNFGTRWAVRCDFSAGSKAPTLLLLHGFTGSGMDFQPMIAEIAEGLANFMSIDFPGHGSSDAPVEHHSYKLANALDMIERIRLLAPNPDKVILTGYSMGARVSLHFLTANRAMKGILIGGTPGLSDKKERLARSLSDSEWINKLSDPDYTIEEFCAEWEAQPLILPQTHLPQPLAGEIASRRRKNNRVGLANCLKESGSGTLPGLWESLNKQSGHLLIVGQYDAKFARIAQQMIHKNELMKMATIRLSGHSPHLENPHETAKAIMAFIAGNSPADQSSS